MKINPLLKIADFGQSIWMDFIRRNLITSGELERLIEEDGLRGVTSNPTIFEKAINGSHDYDEQIKKLSLEDKTADEIYQAVSVGDIRAACDQFLPLFNRLDGLDGFVSLEVSPRLARNTAGTLEEARRLWAAVSRPNVMIKVPATEEGLPAIETLIKEGINVNITLLFGIPRYRKVVEAYLAGLEARAAKGLPLKGISSVASFFLSRIDTLVDPLLEKFVHSDDPRREPASRCLGQVAIASAKIAYQIYKETFGGSRFRALKDEGAKTQRLLWASTSTKNPSYSDVMYVEALIGPDTINTLPMETINAYRDHGNPAARLEEKLEAARSVLTGLIDIGIDIDEITRQVEIEGIRKFVEPFDKLLSAIEKRRKEAFTEHVDSQLIHPGKGEAAFRRSMESAEKEGFVERLWRKDPGLWKPDPDDQMIIRNGLGWLHVAGKMEEHARELEEFTREVRDAGFLQVVHMGMGGSSLAPLVLREFFPALKSAVPLTILDTTDPVTIRKVEKRIPAEKTLFIVASKSGTTAEPLAFADYFYRRVFSVKGSRAGENFVAITDPATPLEREARDKGYRRSFLNFTDIGGRYSALSYFGLVPAALIGVDVSEFLARALRMEHACSPCVPARENPGLALGALIGSMAPGGRNKLTFFMPEAIASLGLWLEQLLAESTGKEGKGVLPVAGEPIEEPGVYGNDRFFAYITMTGISDSRLEKGVAALAEAGFPVVTIRLDDPFDLAQEFYRWEVATAVAGAFLGINVFDQPNVQESKTNTNRLLEAVGEKRKLPEEKPLFTEKLLSIYAREGQSDLKGVIRGFLSQAGSGDYISLQAYLDENTENDELLRQIRKHLLERLHVATTIGYGPRFLHSTGQFHKGGPNTGLFIQITADEPDDEPIPERPYTFGTFIRAQALGDFEALRKHDRRVMRIHLGGDPARGLLSLKDCISEALR